MTLEQHTTEMRIKDMLTPGLKQIGQAARDAAQTVTQSFDRANESQRRFNMDRAALVGGLRELQGIASDFARSAADEAAGQERLQVAIQNTGRSYDQISGKINDLIKRGTELSFADDQVVEALTRLTTTTGSSEAAMADLGLAMDLARARHIDLATAADIVGKVATGNTGILARYGIAVQEGATANEALLAIQQRVAGQSEAYASTVEGNVARISNAVADFGENLFGQNEQLQTFLSLMPGVNAAYSALAGVVAGLGGFGAIAEFSGPLALIAGGGLLAYGYSQDSMGNTATNKAVNEFFLNASKLFNYALPGSPFDTNKYTNQMALNDIGDALIAIFGGGSNADAVRRANLALGNPAFADKSGTNVFNFDENELKKYIQQEAAKAGVTVGEYLLTAAKGAPGLVYDPVSQTYKTPGEYASAQQFRYFNNGGNLTSGATTMGYGSLAAMGPQPTPRYYGDITQTAYTGPYQPNTVSGTGATVRRTYVGDPGYQQAGVPFTGAGGDSATGGGMQVGIGAADITRIIQQERDAYYGLATAQQAATQGLSEFKAVQDSLIAHENVYGQQIGEYNSQLDAQTAAYDILKQRQEDGVALTKEQINFLGKYDEATARGTAGVEDATVAQGMLAQQYLLNMEKGDQLNQSIQDQTGSVGDLVTVIEDLILSLYGVPEEVRTRIELDRAAEAGAELQTILDILNAIDGRTVNFVINASGNGVALGNPNGPSIDPGEGYAIGGMIPAAAHGRMLGRGYTLVGEGGPELLVGGRGGMVVPASATRAMRRTNADVMNIGTVNVYTNDPRQFGSALREQAIGASR